MSRLFAVLRTMAKVAEWFDTERPSNITVPPETIEGLPGLVVIEREGRRVIRSLQWWFPRLTREARLRGNELGLVGLVADLTNPMWDRMVVDPQYRCLIPLTHFANPAGAPGSKTRTWFSIKDEPMMTWAGFCRTLPDVGPVFAGMTMTANSLVEPSNDRMPVLLDRSEHDPWLHGSIEDVIHFQFREPMAADGMDLQSTNDSWRSGKAPTLLNRAEQIGLDF
ncbi:SOS response-associated peptidase family protein [uncultured Sphingorhabdus sp.]|uniref:SOS response-associated peptidase family protein n=1 Tax=uncultured Sphingorhabdus sp. TaxID=1686106 RepID=UPI00262876E3|nr:SOS response-associated peptidase family protein [uncultured Sphingorhabdus sp.]HMS20037.1 SOS response-associated peptidase family protein [Sphingorhabdus sp.]